MGSERAYIFIWKLSLAVLTCLAHVKSQVQTQDFRPEVTAQCTAGMMIITVITDTPFEGVIHARDYRKPECSSYGQGGRNSTLTVSILADNRAETYCGVQLDQTREERSFPVAVRVHRTLELAEDKFYVITCGKSWFRNSRNETGNVSLELLKEGRKTTEVIVGRKYTLRAHISKLEGNYGIKVKSCFTFSGNNSDANLIDDRGCPLNDIITSFEYNATTRTADATLRKMFKFPGSHKVHFQCEIVVCQGQCPPLLCSERYESLPSPQARAADIRGDSSSKEKVIMASTTVFVLEPGEGPLLEPLVQCSIHPSWLLYLCIALGVFFVIMLITNIFLCTAMNCSCTKTEVIEKEPSIIEDYDPYKITWSGAGSHYGSRFSLNGKGGGYMSGGSTLNSTRSYSTAGSDHYAIVHSRPGSRYSSSRTGADRRNHHGPPSTAGSHRSYHSNGKI